MIYAHGGLNDEEVSIGRIRIMAPYFKANGIYPLFVTWRTGFGETLRAILEDQAKRFGIDLEALRARGMFEDIKDAVLEAKDRAFEAVAEKILAKAVWTQMKQNAQAAITAGARPAPARGPSRDAARRARQGSRDPPARPFGRRDPARPSEQPAGGA